MDTERVICQLALVSEALCAARQINGNLFFAGGLAEGLQLLGRRRQRARVPALQQHRLAVVGQGGIVHPDIGAQKQHPPVQLAVGQVLPHPLRIVGIADKAALAHPSVGLAEQAVDRVVIGAVGQDVSAAVDRRTGCARIAVGDKDAALSRFDQLYRREKVFQAVGAAVVQRVIRRDERDRDRLSAENKVEIGGGISQCIGAVGDDHARKGLREVRV